MCQTSPLMIIWAIKRFSLTRLGFLVAFLCETCRYAYKLIFQCSKLMLVFVVFSFFFYVNITLQQTMIRNVVQNLIITCLFKISLFFFFVTYIFFHIQIRMYVTTDPNERNAILQKVFNYLPLYKSVSIVQTMLHFNKTFIIIISKKKLQRSKHFLYDFRVKDNFCRFWENSTYLRWKNIVSLTKKKMLFNKNISCFISLCENLDKFRYKFVDGNHKNKLPLTCFSCKN